MVSWCESVGTAHVVRFSRQSLWAQRHSEVVSSNILLIFSLGGVPLNSRETPARREVGGRSGPGGRGRLAAIRHDERWQPSPSFTLGRNLGALPCATASLRNSVGLGFQTSSLQGHGEGGGARRSVRTCSALA